MHSKTIVLALFAGAAVAVPAAEKVEVIQVRQATSIDLASLTSAIGAGADAATSALGALTSVPPQFSSIVSEIAQITPPADLIPAFLSIIQADSNNPCALATAPASAFPSSLRGEASSYLNAQRSFYNAHSAELISYANYIASVFSTTVGNICTNIPAAAGTGSGSGSSSKTGSTTAAATGSGSGSGSSSGSSTKASSGSGSAATGSTASGNIAPRQTGFAAAGAVVAGVLGLVAAL